MDFPRPNFRGSFLGGYKKSDVEEYLVDVKEQLDRMSARQEAKDKQLQQLKEQFDLLSSQLDDAVNENKALSARNQVLSRTANDLSKQLDMFDDKIGKLQKAYQQLKESSGNMDSSTIQEALLNAQRMSKMVIDEANQMAEQIRAQAQEELEAKRRQGDEVTEAAKRRAASVMAEAEDRRNELIRSFDKIRSQAQEDLNAKKKAGEEVTRQAQAEATALISEAENRKNELQREYDRILMDATSFKAELMDMYRRHLALLATFPEKEDSPLSIHPAYLENDMDYVPEDKPQPEV